MNHNIMSREGLNLHFDLATAKWQLTKKGFAITLHDTEAEIIYREGILFTEATQELADKNMLPASKDIRYFGSTS